MLEVALLASFCNDQRCGKERNSVPDFPGEHGVEAGVGLERLQFFECAVESALETGVVAGETIGQGIEQVDSGFEDMDTAQIPGGCDEFVEESLLQSALRGDFELVVGMQCSEGFAFFGFDDQLLGG